MNGAITLCTAISTKRIGKITLVNNGLVLANKQKDDSIILFSEIEKIYIKKNKFSFFDKIIFLMILTSSLFSIAFYWSKDMALALSFFCVYLMIMAHTHKWYRLYVMHNHNTFCVKVFYQNHKQEYIDLISNVRKEIFYYQINKPDQFKDAEESNATVDYSFPPLNIA